MSEDWSKITAEIKIVTGEKKKFKVREKEKKSIVSIKCFKDIKKKELQLVFEY